MGSDMSNGFISEQTGFKVLLSGGCFSTVATWVESINWAASAGGAAMAIGLAIQVFSFFRARRAEQRDIERHRVEMAVLHSKLAQRVE